MTFTDSLTGGVAQNIDKTLKADRGLLGRVDSDPGLEATGSHRRYWNQREVWALKRPSGMHWTWFSGGRGYRNPYPGSLLRARLEAHSSQGHQHFRTALALEGLLLLTISLGGQPSTQGPFKIQGLDQNRKCKSMLL